MASKKCIQVNWYTYHGSKLENLAKKHFIIKNFELAYLKPYYEN